MAYDKAEWHYGGKFPANLPRENGGTHIGMFLAWAINRGLEGDLHRTDSTEELRAVRARTMTGREFLEKACDGRFWEEDLNEEGNAFAKQYYATNRYGEDYDKTLASGLPTIYHVADSWENYDRIAAVIDRRFSEWKHGPSKRWWEFWK